MAGAACASGVGAGIISFAGLDSETVPGSGGTASYSLLANRQKQLNGTDQGYWIVNGAPANYDFIVSVTSGSLTSGSTGTLNGAAGNTWSKSGGTCTLSIELIDHYSAASIKTISIVLEP